MSQISPRLIRGTCTYAKGEFIPDAGMKEIREILKRLKLLANNKQGFSYPDFYLDPADGSYWEYVQFEDYDTTLAQVTREYIEKNYPEIDCDRTIT